MLNTWIKSWIQAGAILWPLFISYSFYQNQPTNWLVMLAQDFPQYKLIFFATSIFQGMVLGIVAGAIATFIILTILWEVLIKPILLKMQIWH